jgi:small subunit ribosomal protein S11
MAEEKKEVEDLKNKEIAETEISDIKSDLKSVPENNDSGEVDASLIAITDEIREKLKKKKAERDSKGKKGKSRLKKKKAPRRVSSGKAYVKATYNNTIVTITDLQGNVLSWASAGIAGFKGPKKSTPYAAQIITRLAVQKAKEDFGLNEVMVFVRGVGTGRESAVRSLNSNGLIITSIKDITPIPHNGCRPKKPRKV